MARFIGSDEPSLRRVGRNAPNPTQAPPMVGGALPIKRAGCAHCSVLEVTCRLPLNTASRYETAPETCKALQVCDSGSFRRSAAGRIRFTHAEALNDPFELMPVFDVVNVSDDILDEWASQPMLVENALAK